MKKELSDDDKKFVEEIAKKYNYKYKQAKALFLKSNSKKDFVKSLEDDLDEASITTTSSGVSPGGSGEFKGRFGSGAIKRQYYADEEQRKEASESGFGVVKYLRQKLK